MTFKTRNTDKESESIIKQKMTHLDVQFAKRSKNKMATNNDLNQTILTGRLTADIEISYSGAGKEIGKFSLAVGFKYGDTEKTSFINCTVFGKTATFLSQYTGKGKRVSVVGRLDQSTWTDSNDNKKSAIGVVCNTVHIIDWKEDGQQQAPAQSKPVQQAPVMTDNPFDESEIPF